MSVTSYSITDIGRQRQMNQDYVFTSEISVGTLPNLFIVADGMGGYKAGEYASKCTVDTIVNEVSFSNDESPIRLLRNAIQKANSKIRQKSMSDDNYKGMGTTLVAGTFDGEILTVANVGDSRLYLYNGSLKQITTDHSLVEEMIRMGELERERARTHPDKNIITRAVGVVEQVDVDFFEVEDISNGDMILLCSDGLTNMVEDSEISEILGMKGSLEDKARLLVQTANAHGGKDNIAVVLAELYI
ncbi:MAG TPA: Stp1/IreP family PP2C-type Ser/Thr phosphatase [Lachnospiraceae bacterium]|nr:Stp1/IreP family PP2C-type Ser/Thr phosphatase [Lachnospiraceae bacterium]